MFVCYVSRDMDTGPTKEIYHQQTPGKIELIFNVQKHDQFNYPPSNKQTFAIIWSNGHTLCKHSASVLQNTNMIPAEMNSKQEKLLGDFFNFLNMCYYKILSKKPSYSYIKFIF